MQDVALENGFKVELGPNWVQGLGTGVTQNPIHTLALKNKLVDVFSDVDNLTTFDNLGAVDMGRELDAFDQAFASFLVAAGTCLFPTSTCRHTHCLFSGERVSKQVKLH